MVARHVRRVRVVIATVMAAIATLILVGAAYADSAGGPFPK